MLIWLYPVNVYFILILNGILIAMKTNIDESMVKNLIVAEGFNKYILADRQDGVSTDVFKLIGKTNLYLRIMPSGARADVQVLAHKKMLDLGVKVPEVIYSEEENALIGGRSFMIVEEIVGKPLYELQKINNNMSIDKLLFKAGIELAKINSIKTNGIGFINKIINNNLVADGNTYDDFYDVRLESCYKFNKWI